jgi:hypothetical protein
VVGAHLAAAFRGEQPPRGQVPRGPVGGEGAVSRFASRLLSCGVGADGSQRMRWHASRSTMRLPPTCAERRSEALRRYRRLTAAIRAAGTIVGLRDDGGDYAGPRHERVSPRIRQARRGRRGPVER